MDSGGKMPMAQAMRLAGFSKTSARNPQKITKSIPYIRTLEMADVSDARIARKQSNLLESAHIESQSFNAIEQEKIITHNDKGKKLRKPISESEFVHVPDKKIIEMIESVPGHVVIHIQKGRREKVARYRVPDTVVQTKQVELVLKTKGHFAADKLEIIDHELTDEEQKIFDEISKKNFKK